MFSAELINKLLFFINFALTFSLPVSLFQNFHLSQQCIKLPPVPGSRGLPQIIYSTTGPVSSPVSHPFQV